MTSNPRLTTPGLLAAALLVAGPLVAQSVDDLSGTWRTAGLADTGGATEVVAAPLPGGGWLQLTVDDLDADGRRFVETLLLRQAADGAVTGYLFATDRDRPLALTGSWSAAGALELADGDGAESWRWAREERCRARLTRRPAALAAGARAADRALIRSDCEDRRIAGAAPDEGARPETPVAATTPEGRPLDAKPAETGAAEAADPAPGPPTVAPEDETAASGSGAVEVDVADLPASQTRPAPSAASGPTVLLAGRGKPYDEVKKAIDLLHEFLTEQGVAVEVPSDEIVVLQAADSSLAYLVRETRDRRAASLLYVTAAFGGRERIVVDCYDPNGLLLWTEKTVGGTGMREFKWVNPKLVERIEEKLAGRIGGVGLPRAEPANPSP